MYFSTGPVRWYIKIGTSPSSFAGRDGKLAGSGEEMGTATSTLGEAGPDSAVKTAHDKTTAELLNKITGNLHQDVGSTTYSIG